MYFYIISVFPLLFLLIFHNIIGEIYFGTGTACFFVIITNQFCRIMIQQPQSLAYISNSKMFASFIKNFLILDRKSVV